MQKVRFKSDKKVPYQLYVLATPHLNNQGNDNNGWIDSYKGVSMLFAQSNGLSLACTAPLLKRSVGYVGVSDGWTDVHQHKNMTWEYVHAGPGNIALTGEIDISKSGDFLVALSFGRTPSEAANHAWGSILDGFKSAKKWYIEEWEKWLKTLRDIKGKHFRISAAVLHMHEAKTFRGGTIASMSIPWGR